MNVTSYAEFLKLENSEQRDEWMKRRLNYSRRKNNQRLHYKMIRAAEAYRVTGKPCEHRTRVTVFEPGHGESTREEAEVTYCTDTCKQPLGMPR